MAANIMLQEARLRLHADVLGALVGMIASSAGSNRTAVLDMIHDAGLLSADREAKTGDIVDVAASNAMREEIARIMQIAKATAGV